jgi:hypothetical protein
MDFYFFNHYTAAKQRAKSFVAGKKLSEGFSVNSMIGTPGMVASVLVSIFSAYLCWNNNPNVNTVQRVIYTVLAFLFSGIYLVYYLFMHLDRSKFKSTPANNADFKFLQE